MAVRVRRVGTFRVEIGDRWSTRAPLPGGPRSALVKVFALASHGACIANR
jgi:hypothetical protein